MARINYFTEDITFSVPNPRKTVSWLLQIAKKESVPIKELNFIFCSDAYLLAINQNYLKHNTFTDIITFDNREGENSIEGDVFISVDRIHDNARKFRVRYEVELRRVMAHGLLHLLGYGDKSKTAKSLMRKNEDHYLSLWRD
jgi:rRNA maturation RNase YbeY